MASRHRNNGGEGDRENQMTGRALFKDRQGVSAVEFAITLPLFLLMVLGVWQIGNGMWAQVALQHGVEMAARCMAVNPTACGNIDISGTQSYAADQSYGFNPTPSIFSVSQPTCGNQVSADYTISPVVANIGIPTLTVHAQACYQS
jgi:Flp pilus assembly protein TadG